MYAVMPSLYYHRGLQSWQVLEPQTGCLCFAVSKLPGLYYLVRFADSCGYDTYRVFYCYPVYGSHHHTSDEIKCIFLKQSFLLEPSSTTDTHMSTGYKENPHMPDTLDELLAYVALNVERRAILGRQQVTAPGVKTSPSESLSDSSRELTANQDPDFALV